MEANNKVIRQGDVILIYVGDKKPAGKPIVLKHIILAQGELTGHSHTLSGEVAEFLVNGERMVWVEAPTALYHQEHEYINVGIGTWMVGVQVEPEIGRVKD